jgi:hypothetical protein
MATTVWAVFAPLPPKKNTYQISFEAGIRHSSVVQVLQKQVPFLQDPPSKIASQDDPDRQPRFCEWADEILRENQT